MKANYLIPGVTKERVDEMMRDPEFIRRQELFEAVRSGKATAEQIAEYEKMIKPVRELNPMVLVD